MSVLDTFWILFKSDAADVEKGAKQAKGVVDDLDHSIGGADKTTVFLGKKFNSLATKAVAAFASVFAVTNLISSASGITARATDLGVLSAALGESASELVNWGRAVEQAGGTPEGFMGSMRGLSRALNDAFVNAVNASTIALGKMDISSRNSADEMRTVLDLIPELNKKFHGLKREAAFGRGAALGFSDAFIEFLMLDPKIVTAMVARQRELNPVSDEDIARLKSARAEWVEIGNQMSDVATESAVGALDIFEAAKGIEEIKSREREMGRVRAQDQLRFLKSLGRGSLELLESVGRGLGDFLQGFERPGRKVFTPGDDVSSIDINGLRGEIAAMAATPLSAVGAQALAGGVSNRTSSVTVGEVTIETQATDAEGIATGISSELTNQLSNAVEQYDNGLTP